MGLWKILLLIRSPFQSRNLYIVTKDVSYSPLSVKPISLEYHGWGFLFSEILTMLHAFVHFQHEQRDNGSLEDYSTLNISKICIILLYLWYNIYYLHYRDSIMYKVFPQYILFLSILHGFCGLYPWLLCTKVSSLVKKNILQVYTQ